jgi:hypothetical protein
MTRRSVSFLEEPTGRLYNSLIQYAQQRCPTALLVVRHSLPLSEKGESVLKRLDVFLKDKVTSSEWPGTKLIGRTADVYHFAFGSECAAALRQITHALYNWKQPGLPEDLCFLRDDGEPLLVSIAHEREGYLLLSEHELECLPDTFPEINSILDLEA